jgi:hypothetical protein
MTSCGGHVRDPLPALETAFDVLKKPYTMISNAKETEQAGIDRAEPGAEMAAGV